MRSPPFKYIQLLLTGALAKSLILSRFRASRIALEDTTPQNLE
jgi:hypothetical protein